ncbi:phage tail tube protein [Neorhizobium petrolearium]|uniref:Phage tail tube protein n=1 Tax=Neorhizobium petrolearium TaxID=515361 RepID=A0ABY8M2E0_9HYPH|nr:phage tail tube protein [Neorhizobium petrolearium]MCC2608389.1 histidine kinase [Neorhizobium petrolearium]WGI68667.1 phage tail tube protein [Neorhizobium petrolearium]
MPDTKARIGHGITFEMADLATPTDMTYIEEIFDITLPSDTIDQVDASNMQSPNKTREFIDGMSDSGECSFSMNYVPGSTSDRALIAAKGKRKRVRVTFPNGCQFLFKGNLQSNERTAPTDDKMTADVSFKASGDYILTEPTAPRAIANPAIIGTAQVGVPLELEPGIWAGSLQFEYQWQVNNVDVVGATGLSYVPKTADVGSPVTCVVTAINDDFDTEVETAATANVIAA